MRKPLLRGLTVAGLVAIAGLTVSGCAVVDELVHHQKSAEHTDAAAFETDGDLDVPWLPADSTRIRSTQSTQAADATVAVDSDQPLEEGMCTEVPRLSAPAYEIDDTFDVYALDSVYACGTWSVAETPTGWLGWTPNHPDEEAQSPSS